MAEQYLHKYKVEFGQPISFYSGAVTPFSPETLDNKYLPENTNNYLDTRSVPEQAVAITEHNMSFQISKTKDAGKESTITFYNLSDDTRKFLEQYQGDNPSLILYAGYESDIELPLLFKGEVITVDDKFEGHTRTTTVTLKSGAKNMKEAYTVRSYRAGVTFNEIIKDVVDDLKLPKGTYYIPEGNGVHVVTFNKPVIINTPTKEFLRKFSKENGYKFWIEDGTANILPENYVMQAGEFVFDISAETNMIGSPTVSTEDQLTENKSGNRKAITVKTTLNGAYTVGARVNVTSKFHDGVYEIVGITHAGMFEGSDWSSTLELKPVDGWEVRNDS